MGCVDIREVVSFKSVAEVGQYQWLVVHCVGDGRVERLLTCFGVHQVRCSTITASDIDRPAYWR